MYQTRFFVAPLKPPKMPNPETSNTQNGHSYFKGHYRWGLEKLKKILRWKYRQNGWAGNSLQTETDIPDTMPEKREKKLEGFTQDREISG